MSASVVGWSRRLVRGVVPMAVSVPPECVAAGSLRSVARRFGLDAALAPAGATHVSVWEAGGERAFVFERKSWGRMLVWSAGGWSNREAHYVARDLLTGVEPALAARPVVPGLVYGSGVISLVQWAMRADGFGSGGSRSGPVGACGGRAGRSRPQRRSPARCVRCRARCAPGCRPVADCGWRRRGPALAPARPSRSVPHAAPVRPGCPRWRPALTLDSVI